MWAGTHRPSGQAWAGDRVTRICQHKTCTADLDDLGKRRQARYCSDGCGRAHRNDTIYLTNQAREFWKGVRRISWRGWRQANG